MQNKKSILMTTLMLASVCTNAQTIDTNCHRPMFNDGKTWNFQYIHYEESDDAPPTKTRYDISYVIEGDTVIDGLVYKKLYRHVAPTGTKYFTGAWREENLHVSTTAWENIPIYSNESYSDFGVPGELYDFTDTEYKFKDDTTHGCSIDTIMVNNHLFRRYKFSHFPSSVCWVEGVGGRDGLFFNQHRYRVECLCDYEYFVSCYEDGECLFSYQDFEAPPYDVSTMTESISQSTDRTIFTYDLQGRRVQGQPRPGVYIRDGRKQVVK